MNMNMNKILSFIKKQRTAIIASIDEEANPNLNAMFPPRKIEGTKVFYFSTNTSSMRVAHFRSNPKASLYFFRRGIFSCTGVMLNGTMEVLEDPKIKQELWRFGG